MMRLAMTLAVTALAAGSAPAATYLPYGPQLNVALTTVTGGGWTQCYAAPMAQPFGNSAAQTLANCTGDRLMLAGRATGSDTLLVLAQALKSDVLFDTGSDFSGTHNANGVEWYNGDYWSLGFAPDGEAVERQSCDIVAGLGRLCIHTIDSEGGYRINDEFGLNDSYDFETLAFSYSTMDGDTPVDSVPETSSWVMLIGGFAFVGFAARRRNRLRNVSA